MNVYSIVTNDQTARLLKSFCVVNGIGFSMAGIGNDVYVSVSCTSADNDRINDYIDRVSVLDSLSASYICQFADWFKECCVLDYMVETGLTMKDVMNDFANIIALSFKQYNAVWDAIGMLI